MQLLERRTPQSTILDALPCLLPERSHSRVNLLQARLVPQPGLIEPSSVQMGKACTEPHQPPQCKQADDITAQYPSTELQSLQCDRPEGLSLMEISTSPSAYKVASASRYLIKSTSNSIIISIHQVHHSTTYLNRTSRSILR